MKFSKLLLVAMTAMALAACGGGSGGDDDSSSGGGSGNGGGNGNGSGGQDSVYFVDHLYQTLDYAPGGDFLSAYTVKIPYNEDNAGELKLGNSTVPFTDTDPVAFVGYNHLFIGGGDDDIGSLLLCHATGNPSIWHAILPAKAAALEGSVDDKVAKLVAGKRFKFYEECAGTDEVFVVAADGSLTMEVGGVPVDPEEESATAENVRAMLSETGFVHAEPEDAMTVTTWMRVYESDGQVHVLIIDKEELDAGGAPEFFIYYLVQEASAA